MKKILAIMVISLFVLMLAGCVTEKEPLEKKGEDGKPPLMKECFEDCMAEEDGSEEGCKEYCADKVGDARKPGLDDKPPLREGEKPPLRDGERPPLEGGEKPPLDDDKPPKTVETDDDAAIEDVTDINDDDYEAEMGDVI